MAIKQLNQLTPREVAAAKDGWHADGGNLYLKVDDGGRRRRWVFRFTHDGRTTEMGLGGASAVTLKHVREQAKRLRETVAADVNPLAERRRTQAEEAKKKTFGEVARFVIDRDRKGWGATSIRAWEHSLNRDAKSLADLNVADLSVADIKGVVTPMVEQGDHVAARRTLSRIEAVLSCAIAHGWRTAANVAEWSVFQHIMEKREKADRRHPAIDWREAPAVLAKLKAVDSIAARAVELAILTGVRISEAREATWTISRGPCGRSRRSG